MSMSPDLAGSSSVSLKYESLPSNDLHSLERSRSLKSLVPPAGETSRTMGHIQNLIQDKVDSGSAKPGNSGLPPPIIPLWKCCLSELLGTFLLIFIGCGVGLKFKESDEDKPLVHVALCWGFLIATLGQTLHYSCDINPAVTIAKLACGHRKPLVAALYVPIQCVGCLAGAYALKLLTPDGIVGNYGITTIAPDVTPGQAVVIEAICTFFLVMSCFASSDEERDDLKGSLPLSIGLCVCGMIMSAAPYTAASFNPARTLGPSIVANNFDDHWVYWVGPIVGGLIGGLFYQHVFRLQRQYSSETEPPPAQV